MKRTALSLLVALLAFAAPALQAQLRNFPQRTKLGTLEVGVFPQARLDDKPVILAPGVRIHNATNIVVTPQSLSGKLPIRYTIDPLGQVSQAWALTPAELEQAKREAKAAAAAK